VPLGCHSKPEKGTKVDQQSKWHCEGQKRRPKNIRSKKSSNKNILENFVFCRSLLIHDHEADDCFSWRIFDM
jgi:hypothetical protein